MSWKSQTLLAKDALDNEKKDGELLQSQMQASENECSRAKHENSLLNDEIRALKKESAQLKRLIAEKDALINAFDEKTKQLQPFYDNAMTELSRTEEELNQPNLPENLVYEHVVSPDDNNGNEMEPNDPPGNNDSDTDVQNRRKGRKRPRHEMEKDLLSQSEIDQAHDKEQKELEETSSDGIVAKDKEIEVGEEEENEMNIPPKKNKKPQITLSLKKKRVAYRKSCRRHQLRRRMMDKF